MMIDIREQRETHGTERSVSRLVNKFNILQGGKENRILFTVNVFHITRRN